MQVSDDRPPAKESAFVQHSRTDFATAPISLKYASFIGLLDHHDDMLHPEATTQAKEISTPPVTTSRPSREVDLISAHDHTIGERQIHTLMDNLANAIRTKDVDALMAHYAPDVLAFDLLPPLQYRGADAIRKRVPEWFSGKNESDDPERTDQPHGPGNRDSVQHGLAASGAPAALPEDLRARLLPVSWSLAVLTSVVRAEGLEPSRNFGNYVLNKHAIEQASTEASPRHCV